MHFQDKLIHGMFQLTCNVVTNMNNMELLASTNEVKVDFQELPTSLAKLELLKNKSLC